MDEVEELQEFIVAQYLSEFNHHDAHRLADSLINAGYTRRPKQPDGYTKSSGATVGDVIITNESTKWYRGECCSGYPNCIHKPLLTSTITIKPDDEIIKILEELYNAVNSRFPMMTWQEGNLGKQMNKAKAILEKRKESK